MPKCQIYGSNFQYFKAAAVHSPGGIILRFVKAGILANLDSISTKKCLELILRS